GPDGARRPPAALLLAAQSLDGGVRRFVSRAAIDERAVWAVNDPRHVPARAGGRSEMETTIGQCSWPGGCGGTAGGGVRRAQPVPDRLVAPGTDVRAGNGSRRAFELAAATGIAFWTAANGRLDRLC